MVGYNCVLSKARSWRVGIRNSLLDHRRHDDAPRLRYDVVREKTCRGETRDAWHDTARGEGAGRTARGGGSRGLCARRCPTGSAGRARGPGACPRCGGTHLACEGRDGDGSQGRSRGSCGRAPSRRAMGPLGCPEPEGGVWAGRAGHACAGGTLRECAGACGACPGTSRQFLVNININRPRYQQKRTRHAELRRKIPGARSAPLSCSSSFLPGRLGGKSRNVSSRTKLRKSLIKKRWMDSKLGKSRRS